MIIILVTLHLKKKTNITAGLPEHIKQMKVQRETTAEISRAARASTQLVRSNTVVKYT
jgi:hypothetical protein